MKHLLSKRTRTYAFFLFSIFMFFLTFKGALAETITVGKGNEELVFPTAPTNESLNVTIGNETLNVNTNQVDLINFVNNVTQRMIIAERKSIILINALENQSAFYQQLYLQEAEQRRQSEKDFQNFKESTQTQIFQLEAEKKENRFYFIAIIFIAVLGTIMIHNLWDDLGRKHKIYFLLREFRNRLPIDLSFLKGRGGE